MAQEGTVDRDAGRFVCDALFTTITNVVLGMTMIIDRTSRRWLCAKPSKLLSALPADLSGLRYLDPCLA